MKKPMLWMAIIAMILGAVAFPATAGATDQYDEEDESSEIEDLFSDDEEPDSAPEDQYDGEESTVISTPEETTDISETPDPLEEETTEETTLEETTSEETTSGEETTSEETTSEEETTSGEEPSDENPTGGTQSPGGSGTSPSGSGENRTPVPPVSSAPTPEVGEPFQITIIDQTLDMTIVDIYDGTVVYELDNGDRYEILLYDLDYDGWISYYEMYICTAGWFGYRYYDYDPDDVYYFIENNYNTNISNNYQQTGAIRPTPTERVAGMLPDTGGPALIGGAVALAVVGAALVGRYSRRS